MQDDSPAVAYESIQSCKMTAGDGGVSEEVFMQTVSLLVNLRENKTTNPQITLVCSLFHCLKAGGKSPELLRFVKSIYRPFLSVCLLCRGGLDVIYSQCAVPQFGPKCMNANF